MNRIKRYAIATEFSQQDLVDTVSKMVGSGFLPIGGVSTVLERANPKKGTVADRIVWAQALVMPYRPEDAVGEVVANINGGHS